MKKYCLKKVGVTILLCSMVLFLVPTTGLAGLASDNVNGENDLLVDPRLTYIEGAATDLAIRSGVATVDCWVKGDIYAATKAKAIVELQVKNSATNWIPVAIWTDTQDGYRASVYETKTINSENTYRVKATYTVWEGTQSETITVFSDEV